MAATLAGTVRRHPRHVVLAGLVAGLAGAGRPALLLVGGIFVVAAIGGAPRVALLAAVAVLGGALGGDLRLRAADRTALRPWIGHAADIRAVVLTPPRPRSFGHQAVLAVVRSGSGRGEKVLVLARGLRVGVGEELRVRGGFRALPPFEAAARRRGAHALVVADSAVHNGRRRGGLAGALDAVRRRAERGLGEGLPPALAGLARGMVLGDDAALPVSVSEDFRAAGLSHLVAASGANVALLSTLVLGAAALLGAGRRTRLWLVLAAIAAYVPLAGAGPSIQRAGVMGAATVAAALVSAAPSRWYALLLAAAITLGLDPRAVEDPGWQLSFAAVVALLTVAGPIERRLAGRLPRAVAAVAAMTVAASAATLPLIALHFERVSLVTLPANLLAAAAVAPVMWLGTGAALAGQVAPAGAAPLTAVAAWPLAYLTALADVAASVPAAQVTVHASPVALAAVAAGMALATRRRVRAALRTQRGVAAILAVAASATLIIGLGRNVPGPPAGLVVSALDVGQGDATLVQHGAHAVLVDAGPPDGDVVDRLRAAGVRRLDLLVVTHAQADHEGGAAAVLGAFPVGALLDGRDGVRSPAGAELARVAAERRVRRLTPTAGQVLAAGPLVLEVLSPAPEPARRHAGGDPNDRAIVAELRAPGLSVLLAADAESAVLARLPLRPVDLLKVAHHGSADDGLPALLARLRPRVAVIEVGRGNRYGHPAPSTLAALRVVPHVLRTDRDGTVRLRVQDDGIRIERPDDSG